MSGNALLPTSTQDSFVMVPAYEGMGMDYFITDETTWHTSVQLAADSNGSNSQTSGATQTAAGPQHNTTPSYDDALKQHRSMMYDMLFLPTQLPKDPALRYDKRTWHAGYAASTEEPAWYAGSAFASTERWLDDLDDGEVFAKMTEIPVPLPPIPPELIKMAAYINGLPRNPVGKKDGRIEFPSRNTLKKDARLVGEVSRKTGRLMLDYRGGKLRVWYGDERLFDQRMWRYLTEEDYSSMSSEGSEEKNGQGQVGASNTSMQARPQKKSRKRKSDDLDGGSDEDEPLMKKWRTINARGTGRQTQKRRKAPAKKQNAMPMATTSHSRSDSANTPIEIESGSEYGVDEVPKGRKTSSKKEDMVAEDTSSRGQSGFAVSYGPVSEGAELVVPPEIQAAVSARPGGEDIVPEAKEDNGSARGVDD